MSSSLNRRLNRLEQQDELTDLDSPIVRLGQSINVFSYYAKGE